MVSAATGPAHALAFHLRATMRSVVCSITPEPRVQRSGGTAAARSALAYLDAVEVDLDGRTGFVLPDDLEAAAPVEPYGVVRA